MVLKVGIIGAGFVAGLHAEAWQDIPEAKLTVVSDIVKEKTEKLATKYKCEISTDLDSVITDKGIDIVDICVPTFLHKEYVIKAAENNKYILCEKPIARNLVDAKEMVKICKEKKVRFMVGHVLRFFHEYVRLKEQIDSGAVGKPAVVRTSRCSPFPRGWQDWLTNFESSGGVVLDMVIHDFDWLRWCFGEVARVYAKGLANHKFDEPIDYALVTLRFKNKVIAHVEGSWAEPSGFKTTVEVTGDKGLINFSNDESIPIHAKLKKQNVGTISQNDIKMDESPLSESPFVLEFKHFIDCISNNKEFTITPGDAVKSLEVALAVLESIKTGRVITL